MSTPDCRTCKSHSSCENKNIGTKFRCMMSGWKYYEPIKSTVIDISGRRIKTEPCGDNALQATVNIPVTILLGEHAVKEWIKQCQDPDVLHDLAQTAITTAKSLKRKGEIAE